MTPLRVLIVAYGQCEDLQAALRDLDPAVTLVVDNSSDARVRAVVEKFGAAYDDPGRNLGFARAVNRGLALIGPGVDVLLLNPDATFSMTEALQLQECMREVSGAAAASPRLVDLEGHVQRAAWPHPHPAAAVLEALGLAGALPKRQGFLVGAVLLLAAEAVQAVGPFDERFFLYAEEADWQRRALDQGWRLLLVERLVAVHEGAGTSTNAWRREVLFHAAQETYMRKWYGARGWAIYRCAVLLGAAVRALLPGSGARRLAARQRLQLYTQGPRRAALKSGTLPW